jgi:hypothetical protein
MSNTYTLSFDPSTHTVKLTAPDGTTETTGYLALPDRGPDGAASMRVTRDGRQPLIPGVNLYVTRVDQ